VTLVLSLNVEKLDLDDRRARGRHLGELAF
jgi:hypothetical protein